VDQISTFDRPLILLAGAFLGLAIACLVTFFLNRFEVFNAKVLASVVSVIAGAVVTAFLGFGKTQAWVGYCMGLGGCLYMFVVLGKLRVERPDDSTSNTEERAREDTKDPRLEMLDELKIRRQSGALSDLHYWDLQRAIVDDIRKDPAISRSGSRPDPHTNG